MAAKRATGAECDEREIEEVTRRVPTTVTQMRWIARVATVEEEKEKKKNSQVVAIPRDCFTPAWPLTTITASEREN